MNEGEGALSRKCQSHMYSLIADCLWTAFSPHSVDDKSIDRRRRRRSSSKTGGTPPVGPPARARPAWPHPPPHPLPRPGAAPTLRTFLDLHRDARGMFVLFSYSEDDSLCRGGN